MFKNIISLHLRWLPASGEFKFLSLGVAVHIVIHAVNYLRSYEIKLISLSHTHTHTHTHTYTHTNTNTLTHTHTHTHTHHTHTYTHTRTRARARTHARTHTRARTSAQTALNTSSTDYVWSVAILMFFADYYDRCCLHNVRTR